MALPFIIDAFTAETARHYLEIIRLTRHQYLLNGIITSHPWLRLSATPYYLFFPILAATRFHPLTIAYAWFITSAVTVFVNYFTINKIFDRKTAIISSVLLAISPAYWWLNHVPDFFNYILPLTYLLLLLVDLIARNKVKKIWPVFLVIGFMTTLHASALMLLLFFLGLFVYWKKMTVKESVYSAIAFLVPNVPFLLVDGQKHFAMTRDLFLWIPYKVFNFATGKTLGVSHAVVADETLSDVLNFFKASIFPDRFPFWLGLVVIILIGGYFLGKNRNRWEKVFFCWLGFGVLVLIVHKNPPFHYFMPIFILPIILIARIFSRIASSHAGRLTVLIVIAVIATINLFFVFYDRPVGSYVTYSDQLKAARFIIDDARGQPFKLSRIGRFDYYPNQFKDNYEYLLWWLGNRPVSKANLKYTVVEKESKSGKMTVTVYKSD